MKLVRGTNEGKLLMCIANVCEIPCSYCYWSGSCYSRGLQGQHGRLWTKILCRFRKSCFLERGKLIRWWQHMWKLSRNIDQCSRNNHAESWIPKFYWLILQKKKKKKTNGMEWNVLCTGMGISSFEWSLN